MRISAYFVVFCFLFTTLNSDLEAQGKLCNTDETMELYNKIHPLHKKNIKESFENFRKINHQFQRESNSTTAVIPVHVIVVHKPRQPIGEENNITSKVIEDQIVALNRDFNRENADSSKTPATFSRAGMNIVFCLAKIDPFGKPTDGITRYSTSLPFQANEKIIKESSGWPRADYLNIWITELNGVLGFSYIPGMSSLPDETLDGVVLDYRVVGNGINNPAFNLGRVAVHEVGHYLGLQHTFASNGCEDDDGLEDTPQQDSARTGCPVHPAISCGNNGDMFMNYMDYSNDSCKNAFTQMQVDYMNAVLNGIRKSVIISGRAPECYRVPPLVITGNATRMPRCFGDKTASIEIFTQGGKPPFRYFLDDKEYNSNLISGIEAGRYNVKVIDATGQRDSARYTIFGPDPLKINLEQFNYATCTRLTDSLTVKVNAKGGVPGFLGYNFTFGNQSNRTGIYTRIPSGKQIFYVTDFNNCRDSIVIDIFPKKYQDTIPTAIKSPTCRGDKDGQIQIVKPDTGFQYFIDNKSVKDGKLTNLLPGNYFMRVISNTDGCIYERNLAVADPPQLVIEDVDIRQMPCILPDTSKIIIKAKGGIGVLQYSIDTMSWKTSNIFAGTGTGIFDIRVKDGNGCLVKFNRTVAVTQVGGLFGMFEATDAFCNDNASGRIMMTATGGSGMYNYYLNGNVSSRDIRNLKPGNYNVTIEDRVSRCFQIKNLKVGAQPPMSVSIQQNIINPDNTVQIVFAVQGGLPPYLYSIDGGGSFKSIPVFDQLPAGSYTITVLDNNNCRIDFPVRLTNNSGNEELIPVKVYPNPFTNRFQLELPGNISMPVDLLIRDNSGKTVNQQQINSHLTVIENLDTLSPGLYLMQISNTKMYMNFKIVKTN
jgi:hypothetical protein